MSRTDRSNRDERGDEDDTEGFPAGYLSAVV